MPENGEVCFRFALMLFSMSVSMFRNTELEKTFMQNKTNITLYVKYIVNLLLN